MSKKESEFDRYDRMKKLEREAEKKKLKDSNSKKVGRPKPVMAGCGSKNWLKSFSDEMEEDEY